MSKMVAACAKDESVRLQSSSGGIFTVLAECILDDGGVVAGVAQTAPTRFGHIVVENKADFAKRRLFPRQVGRLERLCAAASFQVRKIRICASWLLEIRAPVPEPHLLEYILRWLPLPQAAPYRRHHPGQIPPRPADKDVLPLSVTIETGVLPSAGNARADQAEGCGVGNPAPARQGTPFFQKKRIWVLTF